MNKKIFTVGVITLILDQISKLIIDSLLEIDEICVIVKNFFYITRVGNTGAAFSILEGRTLFLSVISVFCIFALIKLASEFQRNKRTNIAFGLLLGGIFGNFSDRLFIGYVRDFLKFNIFGYNFPIFNIADACIIIGVIVLGISMLRGDDKLENSSK